MIHVSPLLQRMYAAIALFGLLLLVPLSLSAQVISATKTDSLIIDNGASGKADPNDRIRYKVNITNTSTAPANGVQLQEMPDPNSTLVPGSFRITAIAVDDTFACLGNVGITVPQANGLLANDVDDTPGRLTVTAVTNAATAQGGSITISSNGSLSYDPPRGYEGQDTYTYTLVDGNPAPGQPSTFTGTVVINVNKVMWFVNNNAGACSSGCDGRLASPYTSLGALNAVNNGTGANPAAGDIIFMYESATTYADSINLLDNQKLIGQDASVSLASAAGITVPAYSKTLPATNSGNATRVNILSTRNAIRLAANDTIQGIRIAGVVSSYYGLINQRGKSVGNLKIRDFKIVSANPNFGGGVYLANGSGSGMDVVLDSMHLTSNTDAGFFLDSLNGSFTSNAGSVICSGFPSAMQINRGTATMLFKNNFESSGDTIGIENHETGNITFETGYLKSSAGLYVQNCNSGTIAFNNTLKEINSGNRAAVQLLNNSGATINFGNGGLLITSTSGKGFTATGGGTINVTRSNAQTHNSVTTQTGLGFDMQNTAAGTDGIRFDTMRATGVTALVNILNSSGTKTFRYVSDSISTGTAIALDSAGTVNLGHTALASALGSASGTSLSIKATTLDMQGMGVVVRSHSGTALSATGGNVNITGTNLTLLTRTAASKGLRAVGGGKVGLSGTSHTINAIGGGTALEISNTYIDAAGLNFRSISSRGDSSIGIYLNNTGALGGLTVTGDGSNTTKGGNASGGTIDNKGGAGDNANKGIGIYLNNTASVVLRRMQLNNFSNLGIYGTSVNGFTMQYCTINGVNGDNTGGSDACLAFGKSNPSGTNGLDGVNASLIDNCIISGGIEHNMEFYNQSGSFNLTVSNSDIKSNSVAGGLNGIQAEMQGTASATIAVRKCSFDDNKSQAVQASALNSSSINITIDSCTVARTSQGNEGFFLSNAVDASLTARVTNNTMTGLGGLMIYVGQTTGNTNTASALTAVIKGNTITHPANATNSSIIAYLTSKAGQVTTANILIDSNTVAQNSTGGTSRAILVHTPDGGTNPSFTATVTRNIVSVGDNVAGTTPIVVQATRGTGCFDVRNNVATFPNGNPGGVMGVRVRQANPASASLEKGVSSSSDPLTVLDDNHAAGTTVEIQGTVNVVENNACQNAPN